MGEVPPPGPLTRSRADSYPRIYGDWTSPTMGGWKDCLQEFRVRPMRQFRYSVNSTGTLNGEALNPELLFMGL
jgi:hypothetical protein